MERELGEHENEASKTRPVDSTERLIREFYEGLAKNSVQPLKVPGTGNVHSAKSFVAAATSWWMDSEGDALGSPKAAQNRPTFPLTFGHGGGEGENPRGRMALQEIPVRSEVSISKIYILT
jgi:hypothetical protein